MNGTSIQELQAQERMGSMLAPQDTQGIQGMPSRQGMAELQDVQEMRDMQGMPDMRGRHSMQEMQQSQYDMMQNLETEQGHQSQHMIHQNQHNPYVQPTYENNGELQDLARDISDTMPDDLYMIGTNESVDSESVSESSEATGYLSSLPAMTREPLIVFILGVILSNPEVITLMTRYIPQLQADSLTGKPSLTGIIIYSLIFAALFACLKMVLV
jgi:hypothetical protein